MDPIPFYIGVTCVECDEDVYYGLNISMITFNDKLVVPTDMVGDFSVVCSEGHTTHVMSPELLGEDEV